MGRDQRALIGCDLCLDAEPVGVVQPITHRRLDISPAVGVTPLSRAEAGNDDTDRPHRDRDVE